MLRRGAFCVLGRTFWRFACAVWDRIVTFAGANRPQNVYFVVKTAFTYIIIATIALVVVCCTHSEPPRTWVKPHALSSHSEVYAEQDPEETAEEVVPDTVAPVSSKYYVHSVKVKRLPGTFRQLFNDSNYLQLEAAEKIGVGPVTDLYSSYNLQRPIVKIASCEQYQLDELRHSMPYLVPHAAKLLAEIGQRFADTVRARGGHEQRIKVTSVMRTDNTVKRLRRRNRNSVIDSAHRFGTTFDISFSHFIPMDSTFIVSQGDLKNVLAEILYDLREENRCYVKYERKQSCFHITAR